MPTVTRSTSRGLVRRLACTLALLCSAAWAVAQGVELYERPDFAGLRLTLDGPTADLGPYGLGSRVSSVIVTRGQWEFCTQPQFRGACITVGPGRYNRLPPALNDSLASLRPAMGVPVQPPQPPFPPRPEPGGLPSIVLFAGDFSGPELRLLAAANNLADHAFNDSATTIEVRAGQWELCSDGGFGGQCQRFGPGRHALPPSLRDRLSSLRPLGLGRPDEPGRPGPGGPGGPVTRPWPGATPAIVFFENRDFSGRQLPLAGAAANLGAMNFNDRASAVEIFRGRWQLCRHIDFSGDCTVLGPGRYALDGRLQDAVSSARPLFGRDDRQLGAVGAVTLHDHGDFRGRSLLVEDAERNLRDRGYNDRALAIEVHGGRWELCSAADFRGRCFEFGPGWHRLPQGLAGEVSSLRPR